MFYANILLSFDNLNMEEHSAGKYNPPNLWFLRFFAVGRLSTVLSSSVRHHNTPGPYQPGINGKLKEIVKDQHYLLCQHYELFKLPKLTYDSEVFRVEVKAAHAHGSQSPASPAKSSIKHLKSDAKYAFAYYFEEADDARFQRGESDARRSQEHNSAYLHSYS